MDSLAGLNILASPNQPDVHNVLPDPSPVHTSSVPRLTGGPNVGHWFEKLTYNSDGILYEDVQIQIGIKSRYQGHLGQLVVYFGNKISAPLTSFTTTIHADDSEALSLTFSDIPPSTINPRTQIMQLLHVECRKMFATPPILTVSFLAGSHQTISVQLPVVLTKFFEHVKLGQADFFERWKLIGGPPREAQSVFSVELTPTGQLDLVKHRQVVSGHRLNVLDGIDPNPNNIVGAAILHMSVGGKIGCLLRLEPNRQAKVCIQYFP
jgi:AP-2 complex subunit alpha